MCLLAMPCARSPWRKRCAKCAALSRLPAHCVACWLSATATALSGMPSPVECQVCKARAVAVRTAADVTHQIARAQSVRCWRDELTHIATLAARFGPRVQLSHFQLLDVTLGDGPMSSVELARHVDSGCYVALKSYSKQALVKHGKADEALNEKAALQRLEGHPLVARLLATFQTAELLYFVLEYCPGGDLVDHLRRTPNGRLSMSECWTIMRQLCSVVAHCHERHIVHRDIKVRVCAYVTVYCAYAHTHCCCQSARTC